MKHYRSCLWILSLFLIGCSSASIDGNVSVKVNADGSGQYQLSLLTHPVMIEYFQKYKTELTHHQFRIKEVSKGDQVGWIATKDVAQLMKEPLPFAIPTSAPKQSKIEKAVQIDNGFYWKEIKVDYPLDLTFLRQEFPALPFIVDRIHLALTVSLPVPFQEQNANHLSDDQKTATWRLTAGEVNRIYANVKVPNPAGWVITIAALLIILILLIILWCFRRKKKQLMN